jgi:DnaK suppressor protein
MNKRDREKYKKKLIQKKRDLLETFLKNQSQGRSTASDGIQDIADRAVSSYDKEFIFSLSNTERSVLRQVDQALKRVEDPSFGKCEGCEENIQKKRLEAIPWARYCLECQEKIEKGLL